MYFQAYYRHVGVLLLLFQCASYVAVFRESWMFALNEHLITGVDYVPACHVVGESEQNKSAVARTSCVYWVRSYFSASANNKKYIFC